MTVNLKGNLFLFFKEKDQWEFQAKSGMQIQNFFQELQHFFTHLEFYRKKRM